MLSSLMKYFCLPYKGKLYVPCCMVHPGIALRILEISRVLYTVSSDLSLLKHSHQTSATQVMSLITVPRLDKGLVSHTRLSVKSRLSQSLGYDKSRYDSIMPLRSSVSACSLCSLIARAVSSSEKYKFSPLR